MVEKIKIGEGEYNLPETELQEVEITTPVQEKEFNDLEPLEKIRHAAASNGIMIKEPDSNCKKGCYGRGYISTQTYTTSSEEEGLKEFIIPQPCKCIFRKEDIPKMFTGQIALNRDSKRRLERQEKREISKAKVKSSLNEHKEKMRLKAKAKKKAKREQSKKMRNK